MVQTRKSGLRSSSDWSLHKGNDLVYALPAALMKRIVIKGRPPAGLELAFVATTPAAKRKLHAFVQVKMREDVVEPSKTHEEVETKIEASAYNPSARARALLQGCRIAAADLEEAGGAYDLEDVQSLLNGVSRQAIEKRVKEGSLLAVPGPSNRRRYPTMQFTRDGLVPGVKEVQQALPTRNPWAVLNFFVRPDDRLGGRKPIDVLRHGDVALVVSAARGMGVQGG